MAQTNEIQVTYSIYSPGSGSVMLPTTRKTDIGNTGLGNEKESTSQVKIKFSPASTVYVLSLEGGSKMILGGAGWKDIEDEYFVEFMQY